MKKEKDLTRLFSGTEVSAILLKKRLEGAGISALIKNDSADAFFGVTPQVVDLYIQEGDLTKGMTILQELNLKRKS